MKTSILYRFTRKAMNLLTPVWFQHYCAHLARQAGHSLENEEISILL